MEEQEQCNLAEKAMSLWASRGQTATPIPIHVHTPVGALPPFSMQTDPPAPKCVNMIIVHRIHSRESVKTAFNHSSVLKPMLHYAEFILQVEEQLLYNSQCIYLFMHYYI